MVMRAGVSAMNPAALNTRQPNVLPRLEAVSARGHPEWGIEGIAGIVNIVLLGGGPAAGAGQPGAHAWGDHASHRRHARGCVESAGPVSALLRM